jgi:HSP20 family protein
MNKSDFDIQLLDGALVVHGEKHFEREATEGRWRVLQCAYGSFLRTVLLPLPLKGDRRMRTFCQSPTRS